MKAAKLQRLIEILSEFKIGKKLPPLKFKGSKSPDKSSIESPMNLPGIRKRVIFAFDPVECEIIEWVIEDST